MVAATPYIFAGLSVALAFRGGLFNIGAEGQIFIGAITPPTSDTPWSAADGDPPAGAGCRGAGRRARGFIPAGWKARTGAHEVINTIMMNYIAFRLSDWLLTGPMKRPDSFNPVSPTIQLSAMLPRFFADPIRFHLGFFFALLVAYGVYWFLFRSTWGFNLRTAGSNPNAARYAGINTGRWIILTMSLWGAGHWRALTKSCVNHNWRWPFSAAASRVPLGVGTSSWASSWRHVFHRMAGRMDAGRAGYPTTSYLSSAAMILAAAAIILNDSPIAPAGRRRGRSAGVGWDTIYDCRAHVRSRPRPAVSSRGAFAVGLSGLAWAPTSPDRHNLRPTPGGVGDAADGWSDRPSLRSWR
jgi:hypothetical protein